MPFDAADLERLIADDLSGRAAAHQLRTRRALTPISSTRVSIDGVEYVNFASNDYLGLTHHPRMIGAIESAVRTYGAGSGAAALITGYTPLHASAESALARWKGMEGAVLLPSGYQANHAAVQTLAALGGAKCGGVRFLVDRLVHASLIDAVRGSGAEFRVFGHNGLGKLERLLSEAQPGQMQVVVSESIFSMDGDAADLPGLAEVKARHRFILLLDEAHGSGVYDETAKRGVVDVSVVTLSKALGSVGGVVCGSRNFCEAVVNYGRAFIYSTSVPAYVAAAAEEAVAICNDEPQRRERVRSLAGGVRGNLAAAGYEIPRGDSPIIPIIVGSEERALELSQQLAGERLLVPAVRPPTVAKGSSRLRVTVSCDHVDEEIARLTDALKRLKKQVFGAVTAP
jgi:8-amino-7-oxononanoate synthase